MSRRFLSIVAVLAMLIGGALAYRWWNSPERQIRRILADVAAAFTHEAPSSGLDALTDVAALRQHLASDVTVETPEGLRIVGRQDVITTAARFRAAAPARRVRFFDERISVDDLRSATVSVTAEVTTSSASGEDLVDVHQLVATLARPDDRWLVATTRAEKD